MAFRALSIDVPRIAVVPAGETRRCYEYFQLELNVRPQPVDQNILVQHLHEQRRRYVLRAGAAPVEEQRPEDYIVRGLMDFDDVDYDRHADVLYALAGQVTAQLRGYLASEEEVVNVLQYHQKDLVNLVHAQMRSHFVHVVSKYETCVTQGFRTLKTGNFTLDGEERLRDFRRPLAEGEKPHIRAMLFGGFAKCLFPAQRFDSDTERRFAVILENDPDVQKWFKPSRGDLAISYAHTAQHEPDFVVEARHCKYLCEPKRADQITAQDVRAKAAAAVAWCRRATEHAGKTDGKSWTYLLIPHDRIAGQMTLQGLAGLAAHHGEHFDYV